MKAAKVLALIAGTASALRLSREENTTATEKKIRLLLSRHGLSCSNAMELFYKEDAQEKMADPMLTTCGRHRSKIAGEKMKALKLKPDVVLTSSMLRTVETGHYTFPGVELVPVPWLSESEITTSHGNWSRQKGLMDIPLSLEEQAARLAQVYPEAPVNRNMDWMEKFGVGSARTTASWTKFSEFLTRDFLPAYKDGKLLKKDEINVAVITHMGFIRDVKDVQRLCVHKYKHLNNNGLLELMYAYDQEKKTMSVIEDANCTEHKVSSSVYSTKFCQGDFGETCDAEVKRAFPTSKKAGKFTAKSKKGWCCVH